MARMELISEAELHEIRRIWVFDKHELEDKLPAIYQDVTGESFPGRPLDEHLVLGADDVEVLREICGDDALHFEMTRALIGVERNYRTMVRRARLFEALEEAIRHSFYSGKDDAVERARALKRARDLKKTAGDPRPMSELDMEDPSASTELEDAANAPH